MGVVSTCGGGVVAGFFDAQAATASAAAIKTKWRTYDMGASELAAGRDRNARAEPALGAVVDPSGELTAGRVDVVAARPAHGRDDAGVHEALLERHDALARRSRELGARERVERKEIELA